MFVSVGSGKKRTQGVAISHLWEFKWVVQNLLLGFRTLHGHKMDVWCSWWRIIPPVHAKHINVAGHRTRSTWEQPHKVPQCQITGLVAVVTLQTPALDRNLCTVSKSLQTGMHPILEALLGSAADPDCLESWIWRDGKSAKIRVVCLFGVFFLLVVLLGEGGFGVFFVCLFGGLVWFWFCLGSLIFNYINSYDYILTI